jgi:hypothetical protein
LPDGGTVNVVRASGKDAAPGELDGGKSVGSAYKIDVGDQKLSKPITLEIAFDPKSLPKDMPKEAVFLAYYDEDQQEWVPVGGQVDAERNVVSIQTDHLSWWNPLTWNWQAWIAVLKKGLSVKLTDWVEGVQLLTTECKKSGQTVTVDESKANNVLQGCVTTDDPSKPELRVINLKSFHLGISPAPGGPGYPQATILGPGNALSFNADTTDQSPAVVVADFTEAAMYRFLVGLVARMLPAGELIPDEGLAFIADGLQGIASAQEASEKLVSGDSRGAAESIYELITGDTFIETFAKLAAEYGQKNDIEMMTKWTEAGVSSVLKGVAAVDVIVSATDFLANYVLNNHSSVSFSWAVPTATAIPRPSPPASGNPSGGAQISDEQMRDVAIEVVKALATRDDNRLLELVDEDAFFDDYMLDVGVLKHLLSNCGALNPACEYHKYEVTNISLDPSYRPVCEDASPADAANGYGRSCRFRFQFACKQARDAQYEDCRWAVRVQVQGSSIKAIGIWTE